MQRPVCVFIAIMMFSGLLLVGGCSNPFKKKEPRLDSPVGERDLPPMEPLPAPTAVAPSYSAPPAVGQPRYAGSLPTTHIVKKGDTLMGLARYYYGDAKGWRRIRAANGLSSDLIKIGAKLEIPQ